MFICYSDDKSAGKSPVPYEVWKATDNYLQHYNNMMLLDFLATNSKDGVERAQARETEHDEGLALVRCQRPRSRRALDGGLGVVLS